MKSSILLACLAGAGFLSACNNPGQNSVSADTAHIAKTKDSIPVAGNNERDSARNQTVPADTVDISFLKKAALGGMMEVALGNLAQQNGASPRVKFFGEMMIKDHTDANDKINKLAQRVDAKLPDSSATQPDHHRTSLASKKGAAFDKAYMKMMMEDHQEDIAEFQKAANSGNEAVKTFAVQTLPVLIKHLDSAKTIMTSLH